MTTPTIHTAVEAYQRAATASRAAVAASSAAVLHLVEGDGRVSEADYAAARAAVGAPTVAEEVALFEAMCAARAEAARAIRAAARRLGLRVPADASDDDTVRAYLGSLPARAGGAS